MNDDHNNPRGLGAGESGDRGALCGDGAPVGAPAGAGAGPSSRRLAHSLWSWCAGPYGDCPINYDGTYSAAEIDALADQWNRYYFLQHCLAQAGALMRGPAGAPDLAEMGVSHVAG